MIMVNLAKPSLMFFNHGTLFKTMADHDHGKIMARLWQDHDNITMVTRSWQDHGKIVARSWQDHDNIIMVTHVSCF